VTSASRLARLPVHDIQTLQLFMVAFSVAGLLMGARETERTTALRHLADSEQRLRGDVIERQTALEALRHSEERYRTIVQTAREGIWSLDVRRRTNFVNPRMAAMLGYTPEEMVGRPMDDFLDDEGRGIVDEFVTARRASQPEPVDFKLCHRDGSAVWVMVSVAPLHDAKGKREGTLSLATEVTQRRRQEQELADANQELREANALKDHFVAVTSHELRTPLTAILGFTRTTLDLWERLCDEEKLDFLGRIERQSRRLHQLVEDVLTLAALDSGGLRVVCEPVSLRPIIDDAIASVAPIGAVVVSCDPDIRVSADPSRLHQILVNYLVNAVAYGESPLSVEVTPARRTVEVRVRDNGDGVPVEFVPHLFERFTQASAARTRRARGSGLGLAIVAELTEAMGGGAWYEEPGGAGPCFAVSIPGVPADTARRRRSVDNDSEASRVVHT
jgi:PAS domain S-box-containing protein